MSDTFSNQIDLRQPVPAFIQEIAPWGTAPTPILPRYYIETYPDVPLPSYFQSLNPEISTISDLDNFWEKTSKNFIEKSAHKDIRSLASQFMPPKHLEVIGETFDKTFLAHLPLSVRTLNCLSRIKMFIDIEVVTVGKLMSLEHFGMQSLIELMCITEAVTGHKNFLEYQDSIKSNVISYEDKTTLKLKKLLSATVELYGCSTMSDALKINLFELSEVIGADDEYQTINLWKPEPDTSILQTFSAKLQNYFLTSTKVSRAVLENRILTDAPIALARMGEMFMLSRERIRQIEKSIRKNIQEELEPELSIIMDLWAKKLGPIFSSEKLDYESQHLFLNFEHSSFISDVTKNLFLYLMSYNQVNRFYLNSDAKSAYLNFLTKAELMADEAALIDGNSLKTVLAETQWDNYYKTFIKIAGFAEIYGFFALRFSQKAQIKAAILHIGRPVTKEEISQITGISTNKISSQLSSLETVVRADKVRWGLAEWIDDVYEGIPNEIIQRINEDGGTTRLERLLYEIPKLFGVSENSVRAYVDTFQFRLEKGLVSLADTSQIQLKPLEIVVDGYDQRNYPYFDFLVEERYFSGYSLSSVKPEIARELGCLPNGNIFAQVRSPNNCSDITVNWKLSSLSGATIGYLSEPLKKLGAKPGEKVRIFLCPDKTVEFKLLVPEI